MPMLKLYENIKKLRIANNWTQEDLAHKLGYTDRSSIAKIEAGKVDLSQSKIIEFAEVFCIEPGDLLGWDESMIVHDGNIIYDRNELKKEIVNQKAEELYSLYEQASPEIQSAVELLLRSAQHSPESQPKN